MAERLYVGTRKGLFELAPANGAWDIVATHFLGDPVSAVLAQGETTYAALDLGHFGAKLWCRDGAGPWRELAAPAFPPKPENTADDPHPWSLGKIWVMEPGGVPGRLWAGTMPGGLFRSDDSGQSWSLNEALWLMPERRQWQGVAGGEQPGISSVLIDTRYPDDIRVGVSTAGVWATTDGGATWRNINEGMYNEYMPPEQRSLPIAQDIHCLARCAAYPEVVWCQHHNGVFRSEDAGHNWHEITAIRPSKFGFAVAAHPRDRNAAWFVPAVKDERRIPMDGKLVVARTRDGGKSFETLRNGLPQRHAYDLVWRHALAVDGSGERLAMGSTSGGLWISEDCGDSWSAPEARLPPVSVVRFSNELGEIVRGSTMRFMLIRKADRDTEAGVLPSAELLAAMGKYMEDMSKAGVLLGGEGLQSSSKGARVKFARGKPTVSAGPFPETDQLVGGYCLIRVQSQQEAIDWVKRWPALDGGGNVEIEIRQVFEMEDFGPDFTCGMREKEEHMRAEAATRR